MSVQPIPDIPQLDLTTLTSQLPDMAALDSVSVVLQQQNVYLQQESHDL
jgi:hypothetical protein